MIDHFTLRCAPGRLAETVAFHRDVIGLADGPRPPFDFAGAWLYADGRPVLHLAALAADGARNDVPAAAAPVARPVAPPAPPPIAPRAGVPALPPGFDHVALRLRGLAAVRERLRAHGVRAAEQPVPGLPLLQLFVTDPTGARLELTFDLLDEAADAGTPVEHRAANGLQIAFTRRGCGRPLLLLHGGEADHQMFDALGDALAADHDVIAYDQRDSGATRNPATPYSLLDAADDAAALLTALGLPRCDVYGTSLGGQIAQVLAARHPGRVDRLVLGSTWRVGRTLAEVAPAAAADLGRLRADPAANAARIAGYFFPPVLCAVRPSLVEMFAGSRRTPEQRARRAAMLAATPPVDLSTVTAPAWLIAGGDDRLIPPQATFAIGHELRDARTETLPGLGHVAALQSPLALAAVLRRALQR